MDVTHLRKNIFLRHCAGDYITLGNAVTESSWSEYAGHKKEKICNTDIILDQFKNFKEYEKFCQTSLEWIKENKEEAQFLIDS